MAHILSKIFFWRIFLKIRFFGRFWKKIEFFFWFWLVRHVLLVCIKKLESINPKHVFSWPYLPWGPPLAPSNGGNKEKLPPNNYQWLHFSFQIPLILSKLGCLQKTDQKYSPLFDYAPLLLSFHLNYMHLCTIIHLCDFSTWSLHTSV